MTEEVRHEIIQRRPSGMSMRAIADGLGISRCGGPRNSACAGAIAGPLAIAQTATTPEHHRSVRADFEGIARQVPESHHRARLARTASTRLHRQVHGRALAHRAVASARRARPCRGETGPGAQARRWITASTISTSRVKGGGACTLFSYLLSYSRRQYLHFVESMDLPTTLREHVHAFGASPGRRGARLSV